MSLAPIHSNLRLFANNNTAFPHAPYKIYVVFFLFVYLFHFHCTLFCDKGGQVTKPIILVKICYKLLLLYVVEGVENSFGKVTSWPQSLIGLAPFLHPGVFLLSIEYYYKWHV